jgi:pyruvate/2-oxoacid:ferredoxin oxidoreductase beta subunit/Pyruvate/2-oxoacid:ferredoxin oxidoreductase gamma subunit
MPSFINSSRPPAYCPGCSHEVVTRALDKAFLQMNLHENQVVIVSDIGCSGLFDTFFKTHAFHGLHGRALTYATGIKLARPDLHVVVTMGDGGLGIGGAHLLSTCRRNIDITLLILNNFNYGMTGGQFSATTPPDALVGSGFLNQIEKPMDACRVMRAAGAGYVTRISAYQKDLSAEMEQAIRFNGFSAMDIWGICPGRYTRRNKTTFKTIQASIEKLPSFHGPIQENLREEYGEHYREKASSQKPSPAPMEVTKKFPALFKGRKEILILGSAGQRIITAGEILCYAGLTAGLHATQKNDYPITVLRGHSACEVILSPDKIDYAGITAPDVVLALGQEGIDRKTAIFSTCKDNTFVLVDSKAEIPDCRGTIRSIDFKGKKIKRQDMAMVALSLLAQQAGLINLDMLEAALRVRFKSNTLDGVIALVQQAQKMMD